VREIVRFFVIFAATCIGGVFVHEFGHAMGGWVQGIVVVPTPAKEYILQAHVEWQQMTWIALGGVAATTFLTFGTVIWYVRQSQPTADAVLAGMLVPPLAYTVRFLLVGRGHDDIEWQAAQSALGAAPAGHAIDLLFACLSIVGIAAWIGLRGRSLRGSSIAKAAGLMFCGLVLLVIIQIANNVLFDGFFQYTQTLNKPPMLDPR
jgi:hypothetical protein